MQPIVISEVRVSFEEFVRLHQQLLGWRMWVNRLILAFVPALTIWLSGDGLFPSTGLALAFCILFPVVMLTLAHFSKQRMLKKLYQDNPAYTTPATYTLTDDTIAVASPTGQSTLQWTAIRKVQVLPSWWVMRTANGTVMLLPMGRVQPPATPADVTMLFQRHGL